MERKLNKNELDLWKEVTKEDKKINLVQKEKITSKTIGNEFILPAKKPVTIKRKLQKLLKVQIFYQKKIMIMQNKYLII